MRKKVFAILIIFVVLGAGCRIEHIPDTAPMAIMINDEVYYYLGEYTDRDFEESEYAGKIVAVSDASKLPSKNGEANFPCENAPYVFYNGGIALYINERWAILNPNNDS